MSKKAEEWQSSCITKLLPLRGKGFDIAVDNLMFDYGTGLTARLRMEGHEVPELLLAPGDAFGSMAATELDAELERWSKWLATKSLASLKKLTPAKLAPFQKLTKAELEAAYADWKKEHDPEPKKRIARQKKALEAAAKRFPAFAAHVQKVWGLPIPKSLIPVRALLDFGANEDSTMAGEAVRSAELSSAGVLERFAVGGLDRKVAKGKDERCLGRYFRDPPELLTFLHGGEDGLHFGLWYDEDDRLPIRVMQNYARDSGETWLAGQTPMGAIVSRFEAREPAPGRGDFRRRFLLEILHWFAEAEEKPGRKQREPRPILGGWGVRCAGVGAPCDNPARADDALSNKPDVVKQWLAEAEKRLADGNPRMANVLGRAMHWKGGELWSEVSGPLLEKVYAALGRKALLGITQAHYAHRNDSSVDVFAPEK